MMNGMPLLAGVAGVLLLSSCRGVPDTPIAKATASGDVSTIRSLLRAGVDRGDLDGAIITAARLGTAATIPILVKAGGDANARSGVNNRTALMHAVHENQRQSVKALLAAGALPNLRTEGGGSALTMASGYGQAGIVQLLLDGGADPRLTLPDGRSALDLAITGVTDADDRTAGECKTDTVRLLLKHAPDLATPELKSRTKAQQERCPELRTLLTSVQAQPARLEPGRRSDAGTQVQSRASRQASTNSRN